MTFIAIILPILLLSCSILIISGLKKSLSAKFSSPINSENISVVIALKNEINNLPALLNTLNQLNYDSEKHEIIFVDDNSEDDSYKFLENHLNKNYKLLKAANKKFPGKKGALDIGIQNSKFDIIAITDADCKPESYWLKSISKKISEGFDIVFGYSPLETGINFISKFSSFENLRNFIVYFSFAGLNVPFSAAARSFAFRKSTFNKLNGFYNTTETLSGDDDLLIREAVKNKMKVGAFRFDNDLVYSAPANSLREYLQRKSRHLKTSHYYLLRHKTLLALWHSVNIVSMYSIFLTSVSYLFVIPFSVKMLIDSALILLIRKKLPHTFRLFEILYLQFFYETFLVINFLNSLFNKDKWK
uniref:Glycosyltransferase n=1 Tax=Ignavibacterium album TaxID=591197 RepID=A0A832DKS4_9BACT